MLGLYAAVALTTAFAAGPLGFWAGVLLAALAVAALGALLEMLLLRRLYGAPELYQLLATFALVLVIRDAALWIWGPEDLLGPKAPGLKGAVDVLGKLFPSYDVFSIFVGPLVLGALWLLLTKTRWGLLVRAATQDREMVGALGVNQRWLFTSVFALGTFLAALGGALQMPHEPANLNLDLALIGEAFVVVVVGGMGSIPGAFVAAVLIAMVKAFCIAAGSIDVFGAPFPLSKLTLVAEFLVMAVVLVWRPSGLFGRAQALVRGDAAIEPPLRPLPVGVASRRLGRPGRARCCVRVPRRLGALRGGADDRRADRRAVRRQPAFPDGRRRECTRSATPPTSASAPTARRSASRRSACRWRRRSCSRRCSPRSAPSSSAGSACASRASTWRC